MLMNGVGILGSIMASFVLRGGKAWTFLKANRLSCFLALITFIYFLISVSILRSPVHTSLATCCLGFVSVPILMISYELAVA